MKRIPRDVSRRILRRCSDADALVLVVKEGRPSRVYGLEEYLKMKRVPAKHRPWRHRAKRTAAAPDPLGAVEGRVHGKLSRDDLYD